MFRNYDVEGPADRVLVYLTLYIHLCLTKITSKGKGDAVNTLYQLAISNFSIPGDSNFSLGGFVSNPANRAEAGIFIIFFLPNNFCIMNTLNFIFVFLFLFLFLFF
jgi:hypothetical protein